MGRGGTPVRTGAARSADTVAAACDITSPPPSKRVRGCTGDASLTVEKAGISKDASTGKQARQAMFDEWVRQRTSAIARFFLKPAYPTGAGGATARVYLVERCRHAGRGGSFAPSTTNVTEDGARLQP